jgi:ubiquinone/menaquinone biosynthesis C-methylase UbiE
MARNQARDAQDLYDERSVKYDDSHHPRFARHCVELAKVQPGEHVLDLACGTGLVSYNASEAVGPSGSVTGVDISAGMLAQAEAKKPKYGLQNVTFHKHSITELDTLDALKDKQFDLITCCSALVLLPDPAGALKQWVTFLKPEGRLITDVTHPNNLISGLVFERIGIALDRPLPWYRLPFQKVEDLCDIMKAAGLHSIDVKLISLMDVDGSDDLQDYITDASNPKVEKEYEIGDADQVFDNTIETNPMKSLASPPEVREKARTLFKAEWAKVANDHGKVQSIDGVFVGIGWKQ